MTEPAISSSSDISTSEPARRGFLYKAFTIVIGAVVGITPALAGIVFFFDPLRKRKAAGGFLKVGRLDSVPQDGTPVRFTVIVERRQDAWTTYLNEPIGGVYVRRDGEEIVAFNTTCPHLGCAVDYLPGRGQYLCPCHDSAFAIDGKRTNKTPPRDMDRLEVDTDKLKAGEVWVKYQDFKTGEEHPVPKV
ncbi:MAG: Rieske (2Fe-2S) domain protein [Planctomycetaceae bacterium]|nr:Rieske (2Fe-2S) domain protein [Planctomycetaceae bacterium]